MPKLFTDEQKQIIKDAIYEQHDLHPVFDRMVPHILTSCYSEWNFSTDDDSESWMRLVTKDGNEIIIYPDSENIKLNGYGRCLGWGEDKGWGEHSKFTRISQYLLELAVFANTNA